MANMTCQFKITKTENSITISFDAEYFFANCADATIDFDELDADPTFTIVFDADNKPHFDFDDAVYDESHLEQFFNSDVLSALIAADSRFDNNENPY